MATKADRVPGGEFPESREVPYVPTVDEAWNKVMQQVRSVAKTGFAEVHGGAGFRFRGVDAVVDAVGPALRDQGVTVLPRRILNVEVVEYETKRGGRMVNKQVTVEWQVRGPLGDMFLGESVGEAADTGDKAVAKAQSVAYRVFLLQALCIPTGETDPDENVHERASASAPPKTPTQLARERLWALCQRWGKSAKEAEAEFATQYGHGPKDAEPVVIDGFAQTLEERWRDEKAADDERERQERAAEASQGEAPEGGA